MKHIAEHIGSTYHQGGDIRCTIKNQKKFVIPKPDEIDKDASKVKKMYFKERVNAYIKCRGMLEENMQKAYSLILGQCTELLKSKLKQSTQWESISGSYDLLGLIKAIKAIIFKFKDQKYLVASLHKAKAGFYALCQHNLTNTEYLECFNNYINMATAYGRQLHNTAVVNIIIKQDHPHNNYVNFTTNNKKKVQEQAQQLHLAYAVINQSGLKQYCRLTEELNNQHMMGNNNYLQNMLKAYQMLN